MPQEVGGVWTRFGLRVAVVVLSALPLASCLERDDPVTTVILVRHAEKELGGSDPDLAQAGSERAQTLAHVLGETPVSAIYATQYARTRNTARPLADRLGLEVTTVASGDLYAAEMAELILSRHVGQTVVIVSHSNTVPEIIAQLGAEQPPVIDDNEYDDLYVVTIGSGRRTKVLPLRYGRETP